MSSDHHSSLDPGPAGENFVEEVFNRLGRDFLFRNPKFATPNGEVELCDLLLLLDQTAVLMEVKTANRIKRPNRTEDDWVDWANRRTQRAISQIERGVDAIRQGLFTNATNERQGRLAINCPELTDIFAIVIVDHPELLKFGKSPTIEVNGVHVSTLTTTHVELTELLTELSTPADLINYLRARGSFFEKNQLIGITELDLLAAYKRSPEQFLTDVEQYDTYIIEHGCWDTFAALEARRRRDEDDLPSLLVDDIIDKLHEDELVSLPHVEARRSALKGQAASTSSYIEIASQLARIRRVDRRTIGNGLIEKSAKCIEQNRDRWFGHMSLTSRNTIIVFLISLDSRERRTTFLETLVIAAMMTFGHRHGIGVVREPIGWDGGFSIDGFKLTVDNIDDAKKHFQPEELKQMASLFNVRRIGYITEFDNA